MSKAQKFEIEGAAATGETEDRETLAAIDEGVRDADSGRTVPGDDVRKLLPKWISASGTRKER